MEIEFADVQELLKDRGMECPDFGIFEDNGGVINVCYWQPKGELDFTLENGFACCKMHHGEKAHGFVELIRENRADLAITPEYSFPWETLECILNQKDKWPRYGKIWCFGMEGINCSALEAFCEKYSTSNDMVLINEDLNEINQHQFFSCLVYLFQVKKMLVCIIQLKVNAASDKWHELEAVGLTAGRRIYYFHYKDCCMLSFICADALNWDILDISNKKFREFIILHPQLNPKPQHDSFRQMRENYFRYTDYSVRIIVVNWSKGTFLPEYRDRKEIKVQESFSAVYMNSDVSRKDIRKDILNLIRMNKKQGMDYSIGNRFSFWYSASDEHCMQFTIDQFSSSRVNNVIQHVELVGKQYFEYDFDNGIWLGKKACEICSIDWNWLKQEFGFNQCDGDCNILQIHHFFEILFGQDMYHEIELVNQRVNVIFYRTDFSSAGVLQWRERSRYLN